MLERWNELDKIIREQEEEKFNLERKIIEPFHKQLNHKRIRLDDYKLEYSKNGYYVISAEVSYCGCCPGEWEYWYVSKESIESGIFTEEELKTEETKRREKKAIEDKEKAAIDEKKQYEKLKAKYEGS